MYIFSEKVLTYKHIYESNIKRWKHIILVKVNLLSNIIL